MLSLKFNNFLDSAHSRSAELLDKKKKGIKNKASDLTILKLWF